MPKLELKTMQDAADHLAAYPQDELMVYQAIDEARKPGIHAKITHHDVKVFFWHRWKANIERKLKAYSEGDLLKAQKMSWPSWLDATPDEMWLDSVKANELLALCEGFDLHKSKDENGFLKPVAKDLYNLRVFLIHRICVGGDARQLIKKNGDEKARQEWAEKNVKMGWLWNK